MIAGMFVRSLLRLPRWKLLLSMWWPLLPAVLLLGLPRLLALQSGRYFDHVMLGRAMPESIILLGICGALGLFNSALRAISMFANVQTRR